MSILAACASEPAPVAPVKVAPDLSLTLPRLNDLGRRVEASQMLIAHYGEQSYPFEGRLSATPERFLMVGLDPMGRELLRITWTPGGVEYSAAPWVPNSMRPENILVDIVLLYWPEDVVRAMLVRAGATLESGPRSRSILAGGREVMRADYQPVSGDSPWTGRLHYSNLAWGYSLDIQTVETRP
ncbi:DUF3261 domain-containing protein [Telmatospirillum siberiense]|uniref:DUF3261 domain-containing protein n=1 Tax=Telmatospirillum siberiense TaxID=382514 RepID=A0A2N3PW23_9PROT|nr:DUF3261 domain-containing protein [Telmatospirillum siberiense]PKU24599.1 hypothetical protein CWS72_10895 [Telmatospirillum siberiense]